MVFSIILLLLSTVLLIDSIGSKQVRTKVIRAAKLSFTNAIEKNETNKNVPSNATLRMRWKGASQKSNQKRWIPIESKQFLSVNPLSFIAYEDRTHGLLISKKHYHILKEEYWKAQKRWFSIFPQAVDSPTLALLDYLAIYPWYKDIEQSPSIQWSDEVPQKVHATLRYKNIEVKGVFKKGKKEQLLQFRGEISAPHAQKAIIQYEYLNYQESDGQFIPFSFKRIYSNSDNEIQETQMFELCEIVKDEAFAWW